MKRTSWNGLRNEAQSARGVVWMIAIVILMQASCVWGRQAQTASLIFNGYVTDAQGHAVADAMVSLKLIDGKTKAQTKTDSKGEFSFQVLADEDYRLIAEKANDRSEVTALPRRGGVTLVLGPNEKAKNSSTAMDFSDQPHFSVAGVTDWTAAGGHGSDTILRTSESLTNATIALMPDPSSKKAVTTADLATSTSADAYRLAGRQDERLGDSLRAVQEFEQAAKLDPSEQNEFEWASELLLHRAIAQAEEVFRKGADRYPTSLRMQVGFGAALFAGSRYEEAAHHICRASDLDPNATSPYVFLGEIEIAAPNPLDCARPKLGRFVELHPESAIANYLYAMALLKGRTAESDAHASGSAKKYLSKAVSLDPTYSEAYLQLGVVAAGDGDYRAAIRFYQNAIQANPKLADAHYRLGSAYDRIGERAKAQHEFALHQQMKQQQAESVEEQRRAVKQFLFATPDGLQVLPPD